MGRGLTALWVAAIALGLLASAAWASPVFSKLPAEMVEARYSPAAGLLPNGKVLVAGGYDVAATPKFRKGAELFNPATGTFEKTAEMTVERDEMASVALPGGKVLIAGGYDDAGGKGHPLKSAEVFNPQTGTFEPLAAEMTVERDGPAATLLSSGKVLIVGGDEIVGNELKSAELYNPATQTFEKVAGEMVTARYEPAAVTLPSGKVLVAGGYNHTVKPSAYLATAELFNPETGTFEPLEGATHELVERRDEVGAVLLPSGRALIAGGYNGLAQLKSLELFNPATNTFELAPTQLAEPRTGPGLVQFADGRLFAVGGYNSTGTYLRTAEESQPLSVTNAASGVGVGAATLNGVVQPEGASIAYFQYGTTSGYGASTPRQSLGFSLLPQAVSAVVGGLTSAMTYHFRIVDEQFGITYGADQTFTTGSAPVTPPVPPVVALMPPVVSYPSQSHSRWRRGNNLAKLTKTRPPVGTVFAFSLNEPATVGFAFTQPVSGRKVGGRCVAQTKANRRKRSCKRAVTRAAMSFSGHQGLNKVAFQGRVSGSKTLGLGTYTLVITATNIAGQRSSPKQLTFTIVK
jgi:hypothetical protein